MANTHIGECAIHIEGGRDIIFRPTFLRIAELGSPKEILELFNAIQQPNKEGFIAAYRVLYTLADECDNLDDVIGYFEPVERDKKIKIEYIEGAAPMSDLHVIGCKLLTDGIIGRPTDRDRRVMADAPKAKEFDPAEFVALGDAHLSGRDWWSSTKIELDKAMKAKYPPKDEDEQMTKTDQKDLFAEIDRIKRERGVI
jgi:hypothetical protein